MPIEQVSICAISQAITPLASFTFHQLSKATNSSIHCPIAMGNYSARVKISDDDIPRPLTNQNFKLEVNGSQIGNNFDIQQLFGAVIHFVDE
jgi:hypothetical protein